MDKLRSIIRSPWLRAIVVVVVVGAWAWFLWGQIDELRRYPWQIEVPVFGAAVLWGMLYFAGQGVCWTLLLRTTGGAARGVDLIAGTQIWLSTMLTRYIPGNIWHIVSRTAMSGYLGVNKTQVVTSATIEQLLNVLSALVVFGLSLPFWRGSAGNAIWFLALVPTGLLLLHPRIFGTLLEWLARRTGRSELIWPYTYVSMVGVLSAYVLSNLVAGLALVMIISAVATVSLPQVAFLIGVANLTWVIGYMSLLTPSGLGVREAVLTTLLVQIVPLPVAIVGSLAYRLALTLGEVAAVGAVNLVMRLRHRPVDETEHQ